MSSERPGHIPCDRAVSARVVAAPSHVDAAVVEVGRPGVDYTLKATSETPATGTVVFEVANDDGTKLVAVPFKILPPSQNRVPSCHFSGEDAEDGTIVHRSDGTRAPLVFINVRCYDADNDRFVLDGAGPGHEESDALPAALGPHEGVLSFYYRTGTASGSETLRVWATDEVGGRSPDASIAISVGPDVNHPPECHVTHLFGNGEREVFFRPGVTRHFTLGCSDMDQDQPLPHVTTAPTRGSLLPFTSNPALPPETGISRVFGGTYVPDAATMERDRVGVTGEDSHGPGPERFFDLVPVPPSSNDGPTCGEMGSWIEADTAGTASMLCWDKEGDKISAEVASQPLRGVASEPRVDYDTQGTQRISMKYVPDAGWTGDDLFDVRLTDAYGMSRIVTTHVVVWRQPPPPILWLPDQPVTFDPAAVAASVGSSAPAEPVPAPRTIASRALGTTSIKRLSFTAQAEVWSRSTLSKRGLLKAGRSPGIVVICRATCDIRSDSVLVTGSAAPHPARRWNVSTAKPGQLQVVTVALSKADKKRLKRARRAKASFTVKVKAGAEKAGTTRRVIRITG